MKALFYDDVLRFLYRSEMFQQLEEQEQVEFLNEFARDEQFTESVAVAVDFQDRLGVVDVAVPEIGEVPVAKSSMRTNYATTVGNVTYFPFGQKLDLVAPLVVIINTSAELQLYEVQVRGLLMPLLELCAQQQRDCVVLVAEEQLIFPHGQLKHEQALRFHQLSLGKEYACTELIARAQQIFEKSIVKEDAEVLFMTAQHIVLNEIQLAHFKKRGVELSAIAFDIKTFQQNQIAYLDKVFFPNM